jgi:hypothetical protein
MHVGFVTKYLSDFIIQGFTTGKMSKNLLMILSLFSCLIFYQGAAFHIVLSQVNPLLGISTGKVTMPYKLIGVFLKSNNRKFFGNYRYIFIGYYVEKAIF